MLALATTLPAASRASTVPFTGAALGGWPDRWTGEVGPAVTVPVAPEVDVSPELGRDGREGEPQAAIDHRRTNTRPPAVAALGSRTDGILAPTPSVAGRGQYRGAHSGGTQAANGGDVHGRVMRHDGSGHGIAVGRRRRVTWRGRQRHRRAGGAPR